jgi:uncharacterized protein YlxW (UPF0749 family)
MSPDPQDLPDVATEPAPPSTEPAVGRRRSHVLVGVLLALLGFALVAQLRLNEDDQLGSLRQDDLVRLLDEVTQRGDDLSREQTDLLAQRAELLSSGDSRRVAEEAARQRAMVQGILAGVLPVEGPGITVTVVDLSGTVRAHTLYNMLQELRNAGAEAVEVSGVRLTASSWFDESGNGIIVDGVALAPPYRWIAIGNSQTLAVALEIPGGALAAIRNDGGQSLLKQEEIVQVTAVRDLEEPRFATPAATPAAGQ